jgi:hypothetical protein
LGEPGRLKAGIVADGPVTRKKLGAFERLSGAAPFISPVRVIEYHDTRGKTAHGGPAAV